MWANVRDRPRLRDVLIAVAFFVLGIVLYVADLPLIGSDVHDIVDLPQWTALVTLTAACVIQSWRSARPGTAFALCLVVVGVDMVVAQSLSVWLVLSDVVYAVALYAQRRVVHAMYVTVAAASVLVVAAVLALDGGWRLVLLVALWLLAIVAAPIGYGRAIAEHRLAAESERARSRAVAELAARERIDAIGAERRRFARDLHDIVAGHLSGIALQSAAALRAGPDSSVTADVLASVRANSVAALGEMRTMIEVLGGATSEERDADTHRTASMRRIDRLLTTARTAGSPVTVTPAEISDLPRAVDVCTYRILAEALTNATNHAPAQPVLIGVDVNDSAVVLTVRNPLGSARRESPSRQHTPHGLVNMAIRAESVGGHCTAAADGDEWLVTAVLPMARVAGVAQPGPKR
ncbi:LuxR family transcriptional regulator [Rhodococcus sp. BGS-1C]|jgi:signal transduction histidine kinase|uniref:sensor histidine kinase n=1 Tax=unclassified Rhodococcus (in: high G+C Gram-positive bacteria) TaxID=192944 RepID=UPI0019D14D58|nr:histidine kinase [Rhodococcus sp. KRD197]